jgi:hypothetical protein
VFAHPSDTEGKRLPRFAWVIIWSLLLGAMSPVLAIIPLVAALLARALGEARSRIWLSIFGLLGLLIAVPFLLGDPGWLFDTSRRLGLAVAASWPFLLTLAVVPLLFVVEGIGRIALVGGVLSLASLVLLLVSVGGPGTEEALLITASFGAAMVVAAALDRPSLEPKRVLSAAAAIAILILSVGSMANGRLGLPGGDTNQQYGFAETLAGEAGPGRVLVLSEERAMIPGEARSGPGLWYRVIDGSGMTQDEVWLPDSRPGDEKLASAIAKMASGSDLRPGEGLAEFSIDWVVIEGPETYLDDVLAVQLDLVPTPLDPEARVYENPNSTPMAVGSASVWLRDGAGFAGVATSQRIRLSLNSDPRWSPQPGAADWAVSVTGVDGVGRYRAEPAGLALSIASVALLIAALAVAVVGRVRR